MSSFRTLARLGALVLGLSSSVTALQSQTLPTQPVQVGAGRVTNTASLTYQVSDGRRIVPSNTVSLDVTRNKRPTALSFHLAPISYEMQGMSCKGSPIPTFTPAPIDAKDYAASPLVETIDIHTDVILALDSEGSNRDPLVRESAVIQVDAGKIHTTITLMETGIDTGVFAGGVPASMTGKYPDLVPCDVRTQRGVTIKLTFIEDGFSFGSTVSLLIDPAGFTFDSRTGALVDGTRVSLIDAAGNPATVYGDDGVSALSLHRHQRRNRHRQQRARLSRSYRAVTAFRSPRRAPIRSRSSHRGTIPRRRCRIARVIASLRDPQGQPFIINRPASAAG